MITTRILDFPEIEHQWRRLEAEGDVPTIFQTFDWTECWWKHFNDRGKSVLCAAFEQDRLLGIAPLYATRMRIRGIPAFRMLVPMGSGESDYNGFILKKGREPETLAALLSFIKTLGWDILRLGDVHAESPTALHLATECTAAGLVVTEKDHTPCPYIPLPTTIDEYLATLTTHLKKNHRWRLKKLNELGQVRFTVTPADIPVHEAMQEFFRLHESRWGEQGQKGALAEVKLKAMHTEAAQRLERYLHTGFLELNGKKIACQYGYTYNNTRYSYLRGWDPEYKKTGVANILLMHLIEEAIKAGVKEYDFMRGNEEYKYEFTDTERKNRVLVIAKSRLKLGAYTIVERLAG